MSEPVPELRAWRQFIAVGGLYGELVSAVMRVADVADSRQAERVVDAVLGPLKLLPPLPEQPSLLEEGDHASCLHVYFSIEGVWHFCRKDHASEDDTEAEAVFHTDGRAEWRNHDRSGRAFVYKPGSWAVHRLK